MANIMPPRGVLKAAAMPAAPPAMIKEASDICALEGSQRFALRITPAAICTEGPSRPIDRPANNPATVNTILKKLSFKETNSVRSSRGHFGSNAAMT